MKAVTKCLIIWMLAQTLTITGYSQSSFPQGFNYQAIARNINGTAISSTQIKVQADILSDTVQNTLIWREEHTVTTNAYGLLTLVVGRGTRTGGSALTFDAINWSATQMFIAISIKNPSTAATFTPMGKAKLWSVPYAMLSATSARDLSSPFLFNGDTVWLSKNLSIGSNKPYKAQLAVVSEDDTSEDPLFEVRRKDGQPVFTVYNNAVEINVPFDGKKGSPSRGGFAIGGFDESKGTYVTDLFRVTPDSIRMYINNSPNLGKGSPSRGGFAIGGFDESKANLTELLRVTHDSTRIYTNEESDKGFAIGYLSSTTTRKDGFMRLNKSNSFIGHYSGVHNTTGVKNAFYGYNSGAANSTGSDNIFIGFGSGYKNTYGSSNIFIGARSGFNNSSLPMTNPYDASNNVFIGDDAGYSNILGFMNVAIGSSSGYNNTANYNIYIGYHAGYSNVSGIQQVFIGEGAGDEAKGRMNTFVGAQSGRNVTSGEYNSFFGTVTGSLNYSASHNTFIGNQSAYRGTAGDTIKNNNTFIGSLTGYSNSGDIGSNNVLLGYRAGYRNGNNLGDGNIFIGSSAGYNVAGDNQLYINTGTGTPLIWGDFANDRVVIDGTGADNPSNYKFYVNGTAGGDYAWNSLSDLRLKMNVATISSALAKVLKLRGVNFEWKESESSEKGTRIGFIAQEVEPVLPEVVNREGDLYSLQYAPVTALLVEAIKEQQVIIDELRKKQSEYDEKIDELIIRIQKLEEIITKLTEK